MRNLKKQIKTLTFALVLSISAGVCALAQTAPPQIQPPPQTPPASPAPKTPPVTRVRPTNPVRVVPRPPNAFQERYTSEKALAVDAKVNVSLCVLQGSVKINGWDRDEARVFVKDGSRLSFKVLQKNRQSGSPVWIMIQGFESATNKPSECLYGEQIEIDVPRGATVSVKGQETRTIVDSVRKASVKNIGGDISMRNIAEGVEASTYEGDVNVENSSGAFALESLNGNIIAFEASPSEIGDVFRAKTSNGAIVLQDLDHRQIEVSSISGTIAFNGAFSSGGLYNFGTSNGAIHLNIPKDTSCKITASYGYGGFNSEIPITTITENNSPRVQRIVGTMGGGDATLNLRTISGVIRVRNKTEK